MKKSYYFSAFFLLWNIFHCTYASVVAIVDSGIDIAHTDIAPSVWFNPVDLAGNSYDEDQNGFLNDINGWNFAQNNSVLIEQGYSKHLTPDVKRFLEIQNNHTSGNIDQKDLDWARAKLKEDEKFVRDLDAYLDVIHGTHVGGIAIIGTSKAKLLTVKIGLGGGESLRELSKIREQDNGLAEVFWGGWTPKKYLESMAKYQMDSIVEIVDYIGGHNADVANFSFGITYDVAKKMAVEVVDYSGLTLCSSNNPIDSLLEGGDEYYSAWEVCYIDMRTGMIDCKEEEAVDAESCVSDEEIHDMAINFVNDFKHTMAQSR